MIYVLNTPEGRVFEFYVLSCAELYCSMYGGTLTVSEGMMHEPYELAGIGNQLELL